MSHRILVLRGLPPTVTLQVEGLVDGVVIRELRAAIAGEPPGTSIEVLLRIGTVVDRPALGELAALGVRLTAESPYLARWLRDAAPATRRIP